MAKTSPAQFLQQVRSEANKVTWPTRRETVITAIMVLIFTALMAIFFALADYVIATILGFILGRG